MPEANNTVLTPSQFVDERAINIKAGVPGPENPALHQWPIKIPRGLKGAREALAASKLLRVRSDDGPTPYLAEICREGTTIVLRTAQGVEVESLETDFGNPTARALQGIIGRAEALARAQHLRELGRGHEGDLLRHGVTVELGWVVGGEARVVGGDGWGEIVEGERVFLVLRNTGDQTVFVSAFRIDVAGDVFALDGTANLGGRMLAPGGSLTFGKDNDPGNGDGMEVAWPNSVPRQQPVDERFLLVVTDSPINLSFLAEDPSQGLEILRGHTPSGKAIEVPTQSKSTRFLYDTIEIPFSVVPRPGLAAEQQTLGEATGEWDGISLEEPPELVSKGTIGGILRALRHVPSFVRVVNEHTEEILVVVTKYHPNRLMTSGGLCVSSSGLGLNYDTTTFATPATKKILAPKTDKKGSMGIFPLWTRREEFALISIFTGTERRPCIENDRVPTGSTVYFRNRPNLKIVKHGEQKESDSSSDESSVRRIAKT